MDAPVIVTVPFARVMKVPVDDEVDVVSVRDCIVSATFSVSVRCIVPRARVARRAGGRIRGAHAERVLVDVVAVHMVQVPAAEKVFVSLVREALVAASRPVLMRVIRVGVVTHGFPAN